MTVGLRVKVVAEDFGLSQETVYASHRERSGEHLALYRVRSQDEACQAATRGS